MSAEPQREFTLSRIVDGDLPQIAAIEIASYEFPWTFGNFADSLRHGHLGIAAHDGGVLCAYCILMPVLEEMHILNLCVAAFARGQGLARVLLEATQAEARARGMRSLLLEVRPSNPRALEIYRRFGFNEIGQRRNYYPARFGRENAIVMRCTFDEGRQP